MNHRFCSVVFILFLPVLIFAQNEVENSNLINGLPNWAIEIFRSNKLGNTYQISDYLNPFYLEDDFDGDNRTDMAVLITEKQTGKKGILMMHVRTNEYFILGAGQNFGSGHDDFSWMNLWKAFRESKVEPVAPDDKRVYLVCPALWVDHTGSPGAVIYWTGKMYKWYQQ